MNILHVSAVLNWGGGEYHIENLCNELAITNPNINNFVLCAENGLFHKRLQATSMQYIAAPLAIKIDPRFALKIGKTCKAIKIDLIHIHDPTALQMTIIADKFYNLPPFVFSKKTSFEIKQRQKTLYKYNYPKIQKILCVSQETEKITVQAIKDRSKVVTIYHGTNLRTKSTQTPFLLRDKLNIKNSHKIIGNIANHIRAKHLDTWVDVANHLINEEQRTDFHFVQIGNFTDRTQALLDRVEALNLTEHMTFLGYTPKASNFIPQFDMALMTSQSEGLPQFIYECMYHKTPVVSTDVGGIPELITNGINGFLAPMHDAKTLSTHILNLTENTETQQRFTELSYNKLVNQYTTSNMAQQTFAIYQDVLKGYT